MANPLVDKYVSTVEAANKLANQYRTETGDLDSKVDAWLNSTTDENVTKVRAWIVDQTAKIEAAQAAISEREAQIRETAEAAVSESSDFDAEAVSTEFLGLRKELTAMRKGFEAFGIEVPEIEEIVSLKTRTTRTGGSGAGTGVSRSSFSSISVNGEDLEKPTFTVAAQVISKKFGKVAASDLRESLTKAHGDVSENYGQSFEFAHTVTGKDGNSHTVTLVAVPTENVRRQPKSDADETDSTDAVTEAV